MCLASKTNLNVDSLLCATVKGFTTYGFSVTGLTQPLFINFSISSVTNFVLSRADLLLSSTMLSGMCNKGILYPFSMTSIMYSFAPISFHFPMFPDKLPTPTCRPGVKS